jgi:hypothetical protein
MTKRALIRVAPSATGNLLLSDARREDRIVFDTMKLNPNRVDWPVLVDHDPDQVVGQVLDLFRMDDVPPFDQWLTVRCQITEPPAWLKKSTPASFGYFPVQRSQVNGWEIVRRGYVNEVSVLSPGTRPAEDLARVCLLRDDDLGGYDRQAGDVVINGGATITRYGIGQVLGVH